MGHSLLDPCRSASLNDEGIQSRKGYLESRSSVQPLLDDGGRKGVVGGWGVDALVHRRTRPHKDLDVLVLRQDLLQLDHVMAEHGFVRTLLWPNENLWIVIDDANCPTAYVMTDPLGRELDIHVLDRGADGERVPLWSTSQRFHAEFLEGRGCIAGTPVACMSPEGQLVMHTGYDLPGSHQADVALLRTLAAAGPSGHG